MCKGKVFINQNSFFSAWATVNALLSCIHGKIFHIVDIIVLTHYFYLFPSQVEKTTPREVYQPIIFYAQRKGYRNVQC